MKLSFDNPLPVGMQSEEEFFNIYANISTDARSIVEKLNAVLPRSITITRCLPASRFNNSKNRAAADQKHPDQKYLDQKHPGQKYLNQKCSAQDCPVSTTYRIDLKGYPVSREAVDEFMSLSEYIVDKVNFKGIKRSNDLRKITETIQFIDPLNPSSIEMVLKKDGDRTIRPAEILTEVLDIPEHVLLSSDILKLKRSSTSC